jgi:hypothetical protein
MITLFHLSHLKSGLGCVGQSLGHKHVSGSSLQAMASFHAYLPNHEKFHVVILATACWAIRNVRNIITFDKYIFKITKCNLFLPYLFLLYCVGL